MSTPSLPTAKPEEVGLSSSRLGKLSEVLRAQVERGHIPGAVAIVSRNGKLAYHESFGVRDPNGREPMPKDAIFRIYSMSKAIVSVATMMLWEEGQLLLNDPVAKFIPEFAGQKVLARRDGTTDHVPVERDSTVQDLLRHTSGLTYEFRGEGPVQKAYMDAKVYRRSQTNADQAATLGKLPLLHQPGTRWAYSRSTDVLGRLVEVISGQSLGEFLSARVLKPLGMSDSGFSVPEAHQGRIAEAFAKDPEGGTDVQLIEVRQKPSFESGGGGMVATTLDYARFLQMMLNGGTVDGARLLARPTVALMTSDHLGPVTGSPDLLTPGYGFGLGFAVRMHAGIAPMPGAVGQYYWSGAAGTTFWVDPAERLFAVLMIQAPAQREFYRVMFRDMVYSAIAD
jgi:CubicO group peptidase (beta-lactamase class C family)